MKTGGGKNFSCFFNYFPKAKSWKAQSFSLRIAQMQKRICHDALFFLQSIAFNTASNFPC